MKFRPSLVSIRGESVFCRMKPYSGSISGLYKYGESAFGREGGSLRGPDTSIEVASMDI
jgi:hypothetical protein